MKLEEAPILRRPAWSCKNKLHRLNKLFYKVGAEGEMLGVVLALGCCSSVAVGGSPGVARVVPFENKYKVHPQLCPATPKWRVPVCKQ